MYKALYINIIKKKSRLKVGTKTTNHEKNNIFINQIINPIQNYYYYFFFQIFFLIMENKKSKYHVIYCISATYHFINLMNLTKPKKVENRN